MPGCECDIEIKNKEERKTLLVLLLINAVMFVVEIVAGIKGDSTALIADSVDMFADASVYGIGLYAIGRSLLIKAQAALFSGIFQVLLGLSVLADVLRRTIYGSEPESLVMMGIGLVALIANIICLVLIHKHKSGEVHMRASWIFSKNDVIANVGVIVGGMLVAWLHSPYPDLIIGVVIVFIVVKGGVHIIKDSLSSRRQYFSDMQV